MQSFMSAKEAAEKWNISQRRVSIFCAENRIAGAMMVGNMWIIPSNAEKPIDKRTLRYNKTKKTDIKPFVKWVGGKSQLVGELEKYIPSGNEIGLSKYAEPFVGGGALLFDILSKYSFDEIYIGDINADLINAYQVVKNDVNSLISLLKQMHNEFLPLTDELRKTYYYHARDKYNALSLNANTAVQKAAHFIFLNKTCFNGLYRVNRKGQFNVPMGSYKKPTICDESNLRKVSEALKNVSIFCGDYSTSRNFIDKNSLVYLDPPYRPISDTSCFTAYSTNCFDDSEQRRLAEFVDEISNNGAKVILSNSDPKNIDKEDNFFEQLYWKYSINKVEATRMINSNSKKRGKINELLICNY